MTNASPPLLEITPDAARRAEQLMQTAPSGALGLRIGVKKGGCAGMTYDIEFLEDETSDDILVFSEKIRFYISKTAAPFLTGCVVDFENSDLESRFTFKNPSASHDCGCGQSFAF